MSGQPILKPLWCSNLGGVKITWGLSQTDFGGSSVAFLIQKFSADAAVLGPHCDNNWVLLGWVWPVHTPNAEACLEIRAGKTPDLGESTTCKWFYSRGAC